MLENKLKNVYERLQFVSVFIDVLDKPLFTAFSAYCESAGATKKRAYARLVSVVYENGGSLTELVKKLVFENENVYVKSVARGEKILSCVENQVKKELGLFSEFASLKAEDFAKDTGAGLEELPKFNSSSVDFVGVYKKRMREIHKYGYGIFSSSGMFRVSDDKEIEPIVSADKISLDDFIGYEEERGKVVDGTRAFVEGRTALNTLLCGDAGAGKSSTVKAVANAFFGEGVRLIELRKDQLRFLPNVMGKISGNPLKFIIFIDDLSFNQNDDNFSMLKAALEGSASAKAKNAVIYATSNRRHIVKESFGERDGDDVHRNDTLQETLSLSERFGRVVLFQKPNKALYLEIVVKLAKKKGVVMDEKELCLQAEAFALRKGNRSARCAEQFIESLL